MNVIKCPNCGFEYLGGEIFLPNHVIGQPKNIIRNSIGEILGHEGLEETITETYNCDYCKKDFNITAKINYVVESESADIDKYMPQQISLFD